MMNRSAGEGNASGALAGGPGTGSLDRDGKLLIAILVAANFLSYFDRALLSAVLEPVRLEFGFSDAASGALGAAFTIVFELCSVPVGYFVDSGSRTRLLAAGILLWSAFTAGTGAATGFASFLIARIGVGAGEASCAPAATSMIGDVVPPEQRARVFGLFMLGFPLGSFAALALGSRLGEAFGWRATFFVAAVPGLIVAAALLASTEPTRQRSSLQDGKSPPISIILKSPFFWSLSLGGVALTTSAYSVGTYLPAFFSRTHGLSLPQSGAAAALVTGLTGVLGLIAGGIAADRASRSRPYGRAALGATGFLIAAPFTLAGLHTGSVPLALAFLALGWTPYFLFFVTAHTTLIDQFDPRLRGRAIGLFVLLANVIGGALGSGLSGILSDRFANAAVTAGATAETARAVGLQQALAMIVPSGLLIASVGFSIAAWQIARERNATCSTHES